MQGVAAMEVFGTPGQQEVERRAAHAWTLLRHDPAFSSHGRAVGLAQAHPDDVAKQIALARLQGVGPAEGVKRTDVSDRRTALEAAGLVVDEYVEWVGAAAAFQAAAALSAVRALPEDCELVRVDRATPAEDLRALDALTQSCEVLLPTGAFLRGAERPSAFLFARDRSGAAVGAAGAVAAFHTDHPRARRAWWGMLATAPARRGEGIALVLGALSMMAIRDTAGVEQVFTGIREGNAPSEALCARLGLSATDERDIIAVDPEMLGAGRITK